MVIDIQTWKDIGPIVTKPLYHTYVTLRALVVLRCHLVELRCHLVEFKS